MVMEIKRDKLLVYKEERRRRRKGNRMRKEIGEEEKMI